MVKWENGEMERTFFARFLFIYFSLAPRFAPQSC
jgi:hypothetical protein